MPQDKSVGVFCVDVSELLHATAKLKIPDPLNLSPPNRSRPPNDDRETVGRSPLHPHKRGGKSRRVNTDKQRCKTTTSQGGPHRESSDRNQRRTIKKGNLELMGGDGREGASPQGFGGSLKMTPKRRLPRGEVATTPTCGTFGETGRGEILSGVPAKKNGTNCNDSFSCWNTEMVPVQDPMEDTAVRPHFPSPGFGDVPEEHSGLHMEGLCAPHAAGVEARLSEPVDHVDLVTNSVMAAMQDRFLAVFPAVPVANPPPVGGGGAGKSLETTTQRQIANCTVSGAEASRKSAYFSPRSAMCVAEGPRDNEEVWELPSIRSSARPVHRLVKHGGGLDIRDEPYPLRFHDSRGVERVLLTGTVTKVPKRVPVLFVSARSGKSSVAPSCRGIAKSCGVTSKRPKRF
uniref:Uncharacterized protein n=1 Tax=Trypanosoma congolense (strain IL3000) TaxID=1068625 RepID=G0UWK9_TRYCI|nr:conserved hypothetical protein [Trypanosoma congolense IL3000]